MLKKGVETIKKVAPSVGSALGKKKVDLLKKMGKTQRTNPENFKKAGGDKLKKEILAAETRVKKAEGGSMNAKNGMSSEARKTILKGVADGVYSMDDFKRYKKTGEIPGSKKRTEKAEGGMLEKAKKFLGKEAPKRKPKSEAEIKKITSSDAYKKADYKTKTKMLGGNVSTAKEMEERIKKQKPSIREQIAPKKKMDRLKELRKELGAGGGVRGSTKSSDIYSRIKQRHRLKKIRKKFGGGKK